jgi:UDP-N-acetylmuramyl pentapeptide phosphotransferase/UDP-N-acetylglucosamine-1-phosphate transferase
MYGLFGVFELHPVISCALSMFTFIVFVNMFNLVDGIDGLASGISILAFTFFIIISFFSDNYVSLILSIAGFGSLLPFLYYNVFSVQKVFLGDNGSLLLGTLLIYLTLDFLSFNTMDSLLITNNKILILMSLFSYPLVDTIRIFTVRILRKKSPFSADKNHIHHHLLRLGFSHKKASTFVVIYTFSITNFSLLFMKQNINFSFVILLILAVIIVCLPTLLTKNDSGSIRFIKRLM